MFRTLFVLLLSSSCALGAQASQLPLQFFDDFEDGDFTDGQPVTWQVDERFGDWSVESGALVNETAGILHATGFEMTDSSIEAEVEAFRSSVGLTLRYSQDGYYFVRIDGAGIVSFGKNIDGRVSLMERFTCGALRNDQGMPCENFDVSSESPNLMARFEVVDELWSLWLWEPGSSMPTPPTFTFDHSEPRDIYPGQLDQGQAALLAPGAGLGATRNGVFGDATVRGLLVPEPGSLILAMTALAFGLPRRP